MSSEQQPGPRMAGLQEGVGAVAWLGNHGTLLDAACTRATVFQVREERALLDVLRARLVSGVVIDVPFLKEARTQELLLAVRAQAPHMALLALLAEPPQAPLTTSICRHFDLCLSLNSSVDELDEALKLLILRSARRMAEITPTPASTRENYDTLQERLRHLEGLVQTTFTISRAVEEHDILRDLRQAAQVAIDVDDMVVLLTDDDLFDLSDTLLGNAPPAYVAVCREQLYALPMERRASFVGDEVLLREPLQQLDPESPRAREARALDAQSYMRLPLLIDQQVIGFVAFFSRQPDRFTGAHLQLGRLFVAQVSATVRNLRLYLRLRQAEERQNAVSQVARLIADFLELEPVLTRIVAEAVRLIDGLAGVVLLCVPGEGLEVRAVEGREHTLMRVGDRVPTGVGQAGQVAQTGQPSIITHYQDWDHADDRLRHTLPDDIALYGVPLSYHGEVLGVLQLKAPLRAPAEMETALDVLLTLAPQAAIAIAKAQLHERVEQDRRQLRAVLDHTMAAVVVCDATGRVLLMNPAAERALQRLNVAPQVFYTQPAIDLLKDHLPATLPVTNYLEGPIEVSLGEGGQFVVHIARITNPEGQVERYVGVAQDVSEIRRVDRMRSDMVGVLTHDIGNLVMLARNPIDMLEDPNLKPDQRTQLRNMLVSSLSRMEQLVRDVTDLDRAEQSGSDAAQSYDLARLVRSVVEANLSDARQKSITLTYHEVRLPPAPLRGLEILIKQAINNLVSNAIKYTPEGGHVDVALDVAEEAALVRVADDGYGIPADKLRFIFDPFYRVKGDRRIAAIAGTGLGLSLVKTIAERHGGCVEVKSELNVGSVFTLRLPLDDRMQAPSADTVVRVDLSRLANGLAAE